MGTKKRRRGESTDDWGQLELLLDWPEQVEYERIREVVVFGSPVAERAVKTATPVRTLYRRATERSANLVAVATSSGLSPSLKRAALFTSLFIEGSRTSALSCSGAVMSRGLIWFAA